MNRLSLIIKVLIILVLITGLVFLNRKVSQISLESRRARGETEALKKKNDNLAQVQIDYSKIEHQAQAVLNFLPSRRSIDTFVNDLDALSKQTNTTLKISFDEDRATLGPKPPVTNSNSPTITLTAEATGTKEAVYTFFNQVEKSHYFLKVNNFEYRQADQPASDQLSLTMEVYVDTTDK